MGARNTRPVTMDDIAREAGVSRALVSMAFRDVQGVNEQTRQRILDTARAMGYRVNQVASRLASRTTNTLGVFLLDLRQDVYADMFDGIRAVAEAKGMHVVLSVGSSDGSRDSAALDSLAQSRVDIVIATGLLLSDDRVREFRQSVPLVSVARRIEGIDSVSSDNLAGAGAATRHLIELGHQRITFLANPQTDGYLDRGRAYEETMTAAGLTPHVVASHYSRGRAAADIAPVLALPLGERPTAVFAHNDQAALGVLDAMAASGLQAPADLSVVGYDNTLASSAPGTLLTTVDIHGEDLGREAAHLALTRLQNLGAPVASRVTTPTLIVRSSSGPPPDRSI